MFRLGHFAHAALFVLATVVATAPGVAFAQTDGEVAAARKLFSEGVKDEEKRDYEIALAKFRKVQTIRDTAGVRFRIGACLEGLSRLKEARAAYEKAGELAETEKQADIANASRDKVNDLDKRLPTLTLTLSAHAPPDSTVMLDDQPVPPAELGHPIKVDPGKHKVSGRAPGVPPYDNQVTLPEGASVPLTVPLDPGAPQNKQPPIDQPPQQTKPATGGDSSKTTLGWILVGGGAVFLAGSGVALLVRKGAIDSINENPGCRSIADDNLRCGNSTRDDVSSAKDRAELMLPISIAAAGVGVAAVGVGVVLLATSSGGGAPKESPEKKDAPAPAGAWWRVQPTMLPGGGGVMMRAQF